MTDLLDPHFDALYREWYSAYQRDPGLAGHPPIPPSTPSTTRYIPFPSGKSLCLKPEMFDGDRDGFIHWWRTVKVYLAGFDYEPSDRQKIAMVLSYMGGDNTAGRFADLCFTQGLLDSESTTFTDFADKLRDHFRPAYMQRIAEDKLHTLKQGAEETVEDFIVRVKLLIIEAKLDPQSRPYEQLLINTLRNGIHNDIVQHVGYTLMFSNATFEEWATALIGAEHALQVIDSDRRHSQHQSTYTPRTMQGLIMDMDEARAEGKCAKCGNAWPCRDHARPRRHMRS